MINHTLTFGAVCGSIMRGGIHVSRDDVLQLLRLLGRTLLWLLKITFWIAGFCLLLLVTIMVGAFSGGSKGANRVNRLGISGIARQSRWPRF